MVYLKTSRYCIIKYQELLKEMLSLGAELVDLGLDTNTAASSRKIF